MQRAFTTYFLTLSFTVGLALADEQKVTLRSLGFSMICSSWVAFLLHED